MLSRQDKPFLNCVAILSCVLLLGSCSPQPLREREQGALLSSQALYDNAAPWLGPLTSFDRSKADTPVLVARVLTSSEGRFGGWSAAAVDRTGALTAISDRGYWIKAAVDDLATPKPTAKAPPLVMATLRDTDGETLTDSTLRDAEGLIALENGGLIISFERQHRLWYYPPTTGEQISPVQNAAHPIAMPPGLQDSPYNGGAEALTALPDGRLLVIAEGAEGSRQTQGWIGTPQGPWTTMPPAIAWHRFALTLDGSMNPTDVTAVPKANGDVALVMIERSFSIPLGFSARLSLLSLSAIDDFLRTDGKQQSATPLQATPLVTLSHPPINDNWEAITLDQRDGDTLWLMTDNNYNSLQRSLLMSISAHSLID